MTKVERLALMEARYNSLKEKEKNIKCPGVLRRLARDIRNLKKKIGE